MAVCQRADRGWPGGFVWTGFDYRGEPSPYGWPNISSQYGVIDLCGFPKDSFFYYQAWWTAKPVLHVFPHWNWPGLEGQEIAVWVHSNLDKVELFHNGQSLGAKVVTRDQHLAWNVKYAPGTIEARGFKDGKQVLTAKRETTAAAAKLVVRQDGRDIAADGEDVAVFVVEVQDGQGRVVPLTDNQVTFKVTGAGKLIGVGNGDPTSHESDIGSSRRAFSGLCMALVQSTRSAGGITLEATSPGLQGATVTIASKAVKLRPQLAAWERAAPTGAGLTGLWRPVAAAAAATPGDPMSLAGGGGVMVFTLRQDGDRLTGQVEAEAGMGFFGSPNGAIEDGRIEGATISFKAGNTSYTGTINGERLELKRTTVSMRPPGPAPQQQPAGTRPAVGPPPDGTDPSFGAGFGGGRGRGATPLVLRRVQR